MHAATDGGSEVGTGSRETPSRLPRAGLRHGRDDVRLVRQALNSDAVSLSRSPLCELPGVVALARHQYAHKVYPEAAALRALLAQAYTAALAEIDELDERRARLMATYLRLARQGVSVAEITRQLGLRSRSFVHREVQRPALQCVTDAFLRLAGAPPSDGGAPSPLSATPPTR